jgi:hypothetical protein
LQHYAHTLLHKDANNIRIVMLVQPTTNNVDGVQQHRCALQEIQQVLTAANAFTLGNMANANNARRIETAGLVIDIHQSAFGAQNEHLAYLPVLLVVPTLLLAHVRTTDHARRAQEQVASGVVIRSYASTLQTLPLLAKMILLAFVNQTPHAHHVNPTPTVDGVMKLALVYID